MANFCDNLLKKVRFGWSLIRGFVQGVCGVCSPAEEGVVVLDCLITICWVSTAVCCSGSCGFPPSTVFPAEEGAGVLQLYVRLLFLLHAARVSGVVTLTSSTICNDLQRCLELQTRLVWACLSSFVCDQDAVDAVAGS
jgi:hypothetical protein